MRTGQELRMMGDEYAIPPIASPSDRKEHVGPLRLGCEQPEVGFARNWRKMKLHLCLAPYYLERMYISSPIAHS